MGEERKATKTPWWMPKGMAAWAVTIIVGLWVLSSLSHAMNGAPTLSQGTPTAPQAPAAAAKPAVPAAEPKLEVSSWTWNYVRPNFYATVHVVNKGNAPATSLRLGVVYKDVGERTVAGGGMLDFFDLLENGETIKPGQTRTFVLKTPAPDLPVYLLQHLEGIGDISATLEWR